MDHNFRDVIVSISLDHSMLFTFFIRGSGDANLSRSRDGGINETVKILGRNDNERFHNILVFSLVIDHKLWCLE